MEIIAQPDTEILSPTPIRVETALSRYPVHRLAKHGTIAIDIREKGKAGEIAIRWEVSHNSKYGQPGPLAYKLDTLIINRRIEEACRPIPRIIRLGSQRDICRELGLNEGQATRNVKKALYQNAFAGITAKTKYRLKDGTEKTLEAGFTRYHVVFTGEKLPDGRTANAVYIVLSDIYMQIINGAMTRPLDYDYLKMLSPAPQRFYELLSYQMYAALKYDRPRAKLIYSDLCSHAPQTRHVDWDRVRSQMNKVHRPHRNSGYISKIEYEETTDGEGKPDWVMFYQPGSKARAEYRAFTKRGGPVMLEVEPYEPNLLPQLDAPELPSPLVAEMISIGITESTARQLATEHDEAKIREQMEILNWYSAKKPEKITDPAAWLVTAIKNGHAAPKGFKSKADLERDQEAKKEAARKAEEMRKLKSDEKAFEAHVESRIEQVWQAKTPEQQAHCEMMALSGASEADREAYRAMTHPKLKATTLKKLCDDYIRKSLMEFA
jgi:hypothetical protein